MIGKLAFALALMFAAVPCGAQPAPLPARELTTAAPIKMPAATKSEADMFYFVGVAGARQRFTVTSKTPVEITLFGPGGDVMLSKEGSGAVTLTAVLSWLDVHTVAVTRANATTTYTIAMSASEPTPNDALFATNVGEQIPGANGSALTRCWEIPGERMRYAESGTVVMLSRSGAFQASISERNGLVTALEVARGLKGDELVEVTRAHPGGAITERRLPFDLSALRRPANLKYAGYYCKGYEPR
jgi:hypothetical protein